MDIRVKFGDSKLNKGLIIRLVAGYVINQGRTTSRNGLASRCRLDRGRWAVIAAHASVVSQQQRLRFDPDPNPIGELSYGYMCNSKVMHVTIALANDFLTVSA